MFFFYRYVVTLIFSYYVKVNLKIKTIKSILKNKGHKNVI